MSKPPSMGKTGSDDFQTPGYAILTLVPFMPQRWNIWECAAGKRNLVQELANQGYEVMGTDILDDPHYDFLTYEPIIPYDMILTNRPIREKTKRNFWRGAMNSASHLLS